MSLKASAALSVRRTCCFTRCLLEGVRFGETDRPLKSSRPRAVGNGPVAQLRGGQAAQDVVYRRNRYQVLRAQRPTRYALLDVRFDGEASKFGLENFLGAFAAGEHWLLLLDLDGTLLPFKQMRVRSSDLYATALPGERLLIVENESCQYQLPALGQTIAVLGTGFDLGWADADWLSSKKVAYWGDIDTWGLQCLARARTAIRHLHALLMSSEVYDQFVHSAVREPVIAGTDLPFDLTLEEKNLYNRLLREPHGRLEQEFLPEELCRTAIMQWARESCPQCSE